LQRFNSSLPSAKKGPNFVIPLAIAGIAAGAYYFYKNGQEKPVVATSIALTNPEEWIDFKVLTLKFRN